MGSRKTITDAVKDAQEVIAEYVQPGPRDCKQTVNQLIEVLDNEDLAEAIEEEDLGQHPAQAPTGQQPHKHQ